MPASKKELNKQKRERRLCQEEESESLLSMLFWGSSLYRELISDTESTLGVLLFFLLSDIVERHGPENLIMWFSVHKLLSYIDLGAVKL